MLRENNILIGKKNILVFVVFSLYFCLRWIKQPYRCRAI
jgi:hypothetical protein